MEEDYVEVIEAESMGNHYPCGRMVTIDSYNEGETCWLKGIDQTWSDDPAMIYSLWLVKGDEEDEVSITMGLTRTGAEALATELMKTLKWEKK